MGILLIGTAEKNVTCPTRAPDEFAASTKVYILQGMNSDIRLGGILN